MIDVHINKWTCFTRPEYEGIIRWPKRGLGNRAGSWRQFQTGTLRSKKSVVKALRSVGKALRIRVPKRIEVR